MYKSMFLVENNVPDVYINESRDFQLLSRLYDLVFQTTRFSIDSMNYISDTNLCNERLLNLIREKVGFFSKINVSDDTMRKVLTAFPYIMRYKGSKQGINLILNVFMHITNSKLELVETDDPSVITIVFYDYMGYVDLLKELIECIRPTGLIVEYAFKTYIDPSTTSYTFSDEVTVGKVMKYIDTNNTYPSGVVVQVNSPEIKTNDYNGDIANNIGFTVLSKINDSEENNND